MLAANINDSAVNTYEDDKSKGLVKEIIRENKESTIIVHEMLTFIQNNIVSMNERSLEKICTANYSQEEIYDATKELSKMVKSKDQFDSIKQGQSKTNIKSILKLFKETNSVNIPTYVAKDLSKLPLVSNSDVNKLLEEIKTLKTEIVSIVKRIEFLFPYTQHILNKVKVETPSHNTKHYESTSKEKLDLLQSHPYPEGALDEVSCADNNSSYEEATAGETYVITDTRAHTYLVHDALADAVATIIDPGRTSQEINYPDLSGPVLSGRTPGCVRRVPEFLGVRPGVPDSGPLALANLCRHRPRVTAHR
ncbi:hypothetical protein HF086_006292 [Spodoptera exigua]|uniref:Uncharacterized protein n=1 Tax=Spodoptera exigua TaxID=7107 RepID=A0A922S9K9_SPOEX|nr:hypothetical protein HF086_006292 [Spodoptera exigua]